jgi:archaellum component FlaC
MSDKCAGIRDEVDRVQERVDDLKGDVSGATGAALHGYARLLHEELNRLETVRRDLRNCEAR